MYNNISVRLFHCSFSPALCYGTDTFKRLTQMHFYFNPHYLLDNAEARQ